jgi:hypothetical protein
MLLSAFSEEPDLSVEKIRGEKFQHEKPEEHLISPMGKAVDGILHNDD